MENLGISLNGKYGKLKLMMKDESTEDEALLWEEKEQVGKNNLTYVIGHYNYTEVEAIYNAKTLELILYNIELDKLEDGTVIKLEIGDNSIEFNKDDLLTEFKNISNKQDKFKFIYNDTKIFETPTLVYNGDGNHKMNIKLWLNSFGHRRNQMHISFN